MHTIDSFAHFDFVSFSSDPIDNVGVFVRVQLFRNADICNAISKDKGVIEAYLGAEGAQVA